MTVAREVALDLFQRAAKGDPLAAAAIRDATEGGPDGRPTICDQNEIIRTSSSVEDAVRRIRRAYGGETCSSRN